MKLMKLKLIKFPKDKCFMKLWKSWLVWKTHNSEGGQNGEVVVVPISLKGIYILNTFILDIYGPMYKGKCIPMSFGVF